MNRKFDLSGYLRERFSMDVVALRNGRDHDRYSEAIDSFAQTSDRSALFEQMLFLGMPADQASWHAEHPGEKLMCVW